MTLRSPIHRCALALLLSPGACVDAQPDPDQPYAQEEELAEPEQTPIGENGDAPLADPGDPLFAIDCAEKVDTGYVKGNAFPITVVTVDGKPAERSTANAYYLMQQAAAADGVGISIVSGFRTMEEQQHLYSCYINCNCNNCNLAAKPGYSNHQSGHALDLNTSTPGVYSWLAAHAGEFGFSETVQGEPWHWEWWGGGPGGGPCGGCEPGCDGTTIIDENCGQGDCATYGAKCVDDELGPRCVFFACPETGTATVCVDEEIIGTCVDGQISTGDCSLYAAYCSTNVDDQARCVSVFCAAPDETPLVHDGCFLDGARFHCDELGQFTADPCPEGEACTVYPDVHCEANLGCPESGEAMICVGDTAIGTCLEGAVVEAADCGDFAAYCSTAGDTEPHCVASFCVDGPDEIPHEHAICLPDGNLGLCLGDGSLKTSECIDGTHCVEGDFGAACVADGASSSGGETTSESGNTSDSSSGSDATSDPDSDSDSDSASSAATAGVDDDADGCSCALEGPIRPSWGLFGGLLLLTLRRRDCSSSAR